ncbi:MAG: 6-phospho-beta-glucosidase [Anaerolineae bacterium]|nr:6-phospho-beta-glucosidase [Anaerolineae bacterium]
MKVTVIGGGSSYTPELVTGFLERVERLPLSELWLMDVDRERLDVVGGLTRRMVAAHGAPFDVRLATDRREALRDAHYIIVQLRVGGMQARRGDEYLGRRHGLVGQETTGVGGLANALRTVPVVLDIARQAAEVAPGALLANFANPAGLVTQALARYAPQVPSVGVCNVPINAEAEMLAAIAPARAIKAEEAQGTLDTLGLNHLSWHRGFTINGEDVWPEILAGYLARLRAAAEPDWDPDLIEALGMIPNYYLHYYYHTPRAVAAQAAWPPSRAEEVMALEAELLAAYAEPDRTAPPPSLARRGGARYSTVATQLIDAHQNDLGSRQVLNVAHRGAVPGWPPEWVIEMPCRVSRRGVEPLPAAPLPPACFGLLAHVKAYELLAVEAAVHGDRHAAYQALLAHPLGPPAEQITAVLDDMLEANRLHLPHFWRNA